MHLFGLREAKGSSSQTLDVSPKVEILTLNALRVLLGCKMLFGRQVPRISGPVVRTKQFELKSSKQLQQLRERFIRPFAEGIS